MRALVDIVHYVLRYFSFRPMKVLYMMILHLSHLLKSMTLNLTETGFVIIDIQGNKCNQTKQIYLQELICLSFFPWKRSSTSLLNCQVKFIKSLSPYLCYLVMTYQLLTRTTLFGLLGCEIDGGKPALADACASFTLCLVISAIIYVIKL